MFTLAYKDDAAWNESRWQNERFNELLLRPRASWTRACAPRCIARCAC